jgi:ubiquitin-small subunit ribosomal protein S27Ae
MAGKDDKGKPAAKKGGGPVKRKPANRLGKVYEMSGSGLKRKNKYCPKCGTGFFMANHKDRWTCGKCGYTEKK